MIGKLLAGRIRRALDLVVLYSTGRPKLVILLGFLKTDRVAWLFPIRDKLSVIL